MLKYPCLVLDHDDTVVRSESTVNYPAFLEALRVLRPGETISLPEYTLWCFRHGFSALCTQRFGFTEAEFQVQFQIWLEYVMTHIPPCFPGIGRILRRQREAGGLICVVSHSARENILRDYERHFGLRPDCIYGWELGPERRKPAPYSLDQIMAAYSLSPGELLMVDDLKPGYDMAESRGVDFAWAGWAREDIPEISQFMQQACTYMFRSPQALEQFLFA